MVKEFTPKFDRTKWNKYIKNPPTEFKSPNDKNLIVFKEEFVKNILIDIKDMYDEEFDVLQASQGDEGAGKTNSISQIAFVYWWFMNDLGMINYDWSLQVCYFKLADLLNDFQKFRFHPYRIYILDEGDELSGVNFMKQEPRIFRAELRRGRKFGRLIFINMPQIKELTSRIATTRVQRFYEIETDRNKKTMGMVKGQCKVFGIPRGKAAYSYYHKKYLEKNHIRNTISQLMKSKEDFIKMPKELLLFKQEFNKVWVFNEKQYKEKAVNDTNELFTNGSKLKITQRQAVAFLKLMKNAIEKRILTDLVEGDDTDRMCLYKMQNNYLGFESEIRS